MAYEFYSVYVIVWIGFSMLAAIVAWMKNRCWACWFVASLLLSPVLCLLVLLFLSSEELYEYTGVASLNNHAYKIYLTKKFKIIRIETIDKFEFNGNTYDTAIEALRKAQSIDRAIPVDVLNKEDHIGDFIEPVFTPEGISLKNTSVINGKVIHKDKKSSLLIFLIVVCGVFFIGWIVSLKLDLNEVYVDVDTSKLASRNDYSEYQIDGELADAFNLGSTYTDVQRKRLLSEINGKLILWDVEVYEVKKISDWKYLIQTEGGINLGKKNNLALFITVFARSEDDSRYIEGLRTGDHLKVKGILNGNSTMRSLEVSPAIVWNVQENRNERNSSSQTEMSKINTFDLDEVNISSSTLKVVKAYKSGGVASVVDLIDNCWDDFDSKQTSATETQKYHLYESCASMDLAGFRISNDLNKRMNFPVNKFLEWNNVSERVDSKFYWDLESERLNNIHTFVIQNVRVQMNNY